MPDAGPLRTVVLVSLLAVGIGGGYVASVLAGEQPNASGVPVPVVAHDPSFPVDPVPEVVPDPDTAPLATGLPTVRGTVGSGEFVVSFPRPRGWRETRSSVGEKKWYVPGNPAYTYGLRVEHVEGQHDTIAGILAERIADLDEQEEHFELIGRTADSMSFTYIADGHLRHGLLRWMDLGGSGFAEVEISVNGRAVDMPGMQDLLATVARGMRER